MSAPAVAPAHAPSVTDEPLHAAIPVTLAVVGYRDANGDVSIHAVSFVDRLGRRERIGVFDLPMELRLELAAALRGAAS